MTPFVTERLVEWGDCDAAGIVYYPNYYRWMDGFYHIITEQLGFTQRSLGQDFDVFATPLIDTGCRFIAPASYGDVLTVTARINDLRPSSLNVLYEFSRGDVAIASGYEARVLVRRTETGFQKAPFPEALYSAIENAMVGSRN